MEKSGFFNAMKVGDTWDRVYKAENFAEYFATFIGNGVFPNPATGLQVIETNKMQVIVKAGKAWINGYIYINTDDLVLDIPVADGVLNRIDKVVLKYDVAKREIRARIKKGGFSSNPNVPKLQRDTDMYELALADIYIKAGAIKISQSDITDLRFNKELCGIVKGTVDEIDTTNLFAQYNCEFKKWFEGIKNTLGADIAGNLLKLITQNTNKIGDTSNLKTTDKTSTVQAINEVKQNLESIKFPVTKVNEQTGNVVLSASDIKMENEKTIEDNINAITNGIGGRNLVDSLNLEKYFTAENIKGTIKKIDDKYPVSKKYFKIDCTKDGKGTFFFPIFQKTEEKVGRIYTFSFLLLSNREKKLSLGHQCGGGKNVTTTKGWQKVTHTWKFTDGAHSNFYFTFVDGWKVGDTICIADLKIEEGSVPSTFTQAPEDISNAIGNIALLETYTKTDLVGAINSLERSKAANLHKHAETDITSGFSQSLTTSGYKKLPGGLILQWGTFRSPKGGTSTTGLGVYTNSITGIQFPVKFASKESFKVFPISSLPLCYCTASNVGLGYSFDCDISSTANYQATENVAINYFAIGY